MGYTNKGSEWRKWFDQTDTSAEHVNTGKRGNKYGTGANQANTNTETRVDMNTISVDPSAITQSFYTNPLTYENYESQSRPVYQQSQALKDAANRLQQHENSKPGPYESLYNEQIQGLIDQILNREKFSYDFSQDPMYQQYAQQYQRGSKLAMQDAMAESAALTGGYGNSYAQQVGQQTFQQYMEDLNNIIPELRDAAYDMYQDEGETMRSNLSMLQTEDDRDYGKYRDTVTDWKDELNYFYNVYSDMSEQEYQRYMNDSAAWEADRAYWYQKAYDEQQQKNWEKEFAAKYGSSSGGSSGGGGGGGGDDETIYLPETSFAGTQQSVIDAVAEFRKKNPLK